MLRRSVAPRTTMELCPEVHIDTDEQLQQFPRNVFVLQFGSMHAILNRREYEDGEVTFNGRIGNALVDIMRDEDQWLLWSFGMPRERTINRLWMEHGYIGRQQQQRAALPPVGPWQDGFRLFYTQDFAHAVARSIPWTRQSHRFHSETDRAQVQALVMALRSGRQHRQLPLLPDELVFMILNMIDRRS